MYDKIKFGKNLSNLRRERWNLYKNNQNKINNPFEKYKCCKSQNSFAEELNVERRTVGKWELGQAVPTLSQTINFCNILDCNIDYLLGTEINEGLSPTVIASHYSKISVDIINYGLTDNDYLDFLNYFMHPTNCASFISALTSTAWKDFLSKTELTDIYEPLKSIVIESFQKYQAFTSPNYNNKNSYKEYIISALPESLISFSPKKANECIYVLSCISSSQLKTLNLSNNNPSSYDVFIDFIVEYSYEILTNKVMLDIQKNNLGKLFVRLFEKYLSE